MRIQELLENHRGEFFLALKDFLPLAVDVLKLNSLPKIKLVNSLDNPDQPTFGKYVNEEDTVYLAIDERHIIDIFRTLAHELAHYKQDLTHKLGKKSGETGSPQENEAHVLAGILMRQFDKKFPHYFKKEAIDVKEGWKKNLGIAALTGAAILGARHLTAPNMHLNKPAIKKKLDPEIYVNLPPAQNKIKNAAISAGIKGAELAQFLGQVAHETANFTALEEQPDDRGDRYFYEKYWKNKSVRKLLGNRTPEDAVRYRGRGLFHLTGRYNYEVCGKALGIDLLNHPELAASSTYQVPIAVWFWKTRVKRMGPNADYSDTAAVTHHINKNADSENIEKRHILFQKYLNLLNPDNNKEKEDK